MKSRGGKDISSFSNSNSKPEDILLEDGLDKANPSRDKENNSNKMEFKIISDSDSDCTPFSIQIITFTIDIQI